MKPPMIRILEAFQEQPLTISEAGDHANLSRAAAYVRVHQLVKTKCLVGGDYVRQGRRGALAEVFTITALGRRCLRRSQGRS